MLNLKLTGYFILVLLCFNMSISSGQSGSDIGAQIEKIKNAEKVEQLYSVRYNLDKLSANNNLSIQDMRRVLEAHVLLANEFKSRNHFRNAADVYLDYLKIVDVYHDKYSKFLVDSVQKANKAETSEFKNKISGLDSEISSLTTRNEKVSGLRSKYFTLGGIATAIILLIFGVIFMSRNKSIKETNQKIDASNHSIREHFKDVVHARMLAGAVHYAKNVMSDNAVIIDELLQNKTTLFDQKQDAAAVKELNEAKTSFLAAFRK